MLVRVGEDRKGNVCEGVKLKWLKTTNQVARLCEHVNDNEPFEFRGGRELPNQMNEC